MKTRITLLLVVAAMMTGNLKAQVTDPTFDPVLAAQLQAAIDNSIAAGNIKGTSVAITVPGQGLFIGTGGISHTGEPVTSDMQFCVGSNSKLFTAVVLLRMQEDGLLSLDDAISEYLPAMPHVNPNITIRQLLNHQSGLFDYEQELFPNEDFYRAMDPFVYGPDIFYYPADVMAMIGPPHFAPGEKYSYSNTNYLVAAMVAEAASGQTFVQKLHEYILDPFDLDHTFLGAWEAPNGTVANAWHLGDDIGDVPTMAPHSMYLGAGNVFSTAADMEKWRNHLFKGDIINASSLADLLDFEPATQYTYGLERSHRLAFFDEDIWTHTGWVPGYTSVAGFDPNWGSVTVLNNDEASFDILFPVLDVLYGQLFGDDAGIESIVQPTSNTCNSSVAPQVNLKNFGVQNLTSIAIHYKLDGGAESTYNWSGSLMPGESVAVTLPVISFGPGQHFFEARTSGPNGNTDERGWNDRWTSKFINNSGMIPATSLFEDFELPQFPPEGWLNTENRSYTWARSRLSLLSGTGCAVKPNWFDQSTREYEFELPMVDLTAMNKPELSFDYAYGYYGHGFNDGLTILVSSDCGQTYQPVFHKSGTALKTADGLFPFYPDDNQWQLEKINLSNFKNYQVLVKFRAISANGNMLYVDNIRLDNKPGNQRLSEADADEFDIYPNPARETLNIRLPAELNAMVEISNLIGQVVFKQVVNETNLQIDVSAYEPGIYVVKHSVGNRVHTRKVSIIK